MNANDKQVGGSHYQRLAIQHWDYVLANTLPYLEAQITRYVSRWRNKNGLQDLGKAAHYLEKLIEHEGSQIQWSWLRRMFSTPIITISAMEYGVSNHMEADDINFLVMMERWHITHDLGYVQKALRLITLMMEKHA